MSLKAEQEKLLKELLPSIISREEWKAKKAKRKRKLETPVNTIVFRLTNTNPCYSLDHCAHEVRKIQEEHMNELNKSDIQYNFIIGREGSVFEGRGWNYTPTKYPEEIKALNGSSVEVAFIGREKFKPNVQQVRSALGLLVNGIQDKHLKEHVGVYQIGIDEPLFPQNDVPKEEKYDSDPKFSDDEEEENDANAQPDEDDEVDEEDVSDEVDEERENSDYEFEDQ